MYVFKSLKLSKLTNYSPYKALFAWRKKRWKCGAWTWHECI